MLQYTKFNESLDISEVVPNLSVCLKEAIATGVVKDIGVSADFNGIDDVENVGVRVEDAFQAFESMHNITNDKTGAFVKAVENMNGGQGGSPASE